MTTTAAPFLEAGGGDELFLIAPLDCCYFLECQGITQLKLTAGILLYGHASNKVYGRFCLVYIGYGAGNIAILIRRRDTLYGDRQTTPESRRRCCAQHVRGFVYS